MKRLRRAQKEESIASGAVANHVLIRAHAFPSRCEESEAEGLSSQAKVNNLKHVKLAGILPPSLTVAGVLRNFFGKSMCQNSSTLPRD